MNQVTLTAEQLELLKADIKAQVIRELTGQDVRSVQERSKPLLDLWRTYRSFSRSTGSGRMRRFGSAFGNWRRYEPAAVWSDDEINKFSK